MNSPAEKVPGLDKIASELSNLSGDEVTNQGWFSPDENLFVDPNQPADKEEPGGDDLEKTGEEVNQAKPLPKDYDNYDDYIKDGHDPDFYQGPKAREKLKQKVELEKQLRSERNETNDILRQVQQSQIDADKRHQEEQARQKIVYEEQMKQARDDDDLGAFEIAQRQHALIPERSQNQPEQAPRNTEPLAYQNLRSEDPRLDPQSSQFDIDYNSKVVNQVNYLHQDLMSKNGGRDLSDIELNYVADKVRSQLGSNPASYEPNPNRQRPAPVLKPNVSGAKPGDPMSKMTPEHRTLYNQWNKGGPRQQEYAKSLMEQYK